MERVQGFTDEAISRVSDDVFEVKQYVEGLGSFIKSCDTPMTIAIQGDWGSGKTSMMNMILENIKDDVVPVMFNTWQYSQFNMGDQLTISFLSELMQQMIPGDTESSKKMKKNLSIIRKTIVSTLKEVAVIAVDNFVGGEASGKVKNALNPGQEDVDMPSAIRQLKQEFQNCVDESNRSKNKDRVVFFVDDLDRLNPGKAVELLEVLKLFLDCKNCVFVLAIDYAVVSQGVKEKYGNLIGEEKGKSFFDKIIQVPFKMPVAHYAVKTYVEKMINDLGIAIEESKKDEELQQYIGLIQNSIGCNPRAMKRLFNAFSLLNKIYQEQMNQDAWNKKMLFAILCMQQSYEELYNYIVANCEDIKGGDLLADLSKVEKYTEEEPHGVSIAKDMNLTDEILLNRMAIFMKSFNSVIDRDGQNGLDENEIDAFLEVLGFSTVTSATGEVGTQDDGSGYYRWMSREIVKNVNKKLKSMIDLGRYQPRKDYQNAKRYQVWGYKYYKNEDSSEYSVEYVILPDLETQTVHIHTFIAARRGMDESVFKEKYGDLSKANPNRIYSYNAEEPRYYFDSEPIPAPVEHADMAHIEDCVIREYKQLLETFKVLG